MQALRGLYGCSNTCPHLGSSRRTTVHRQSRAPPAAHAAAGRPLQRPAFGLQLAAASGESVTGSGNGDPHISLALRSARAKLLSMLEETSDEGSNRTGPAIAAAVENLIKENPSLTPGLDTPEVGVGVWEVRERFAAGSSCAVRQMCGAAVCPAAIVGCSPIDASRSRCAAACCHPFGGDQRLFHRHM